MKLLLEKTKLAAILLAGGISTRMGKEKATLKIGGQTILERTLNILSSLVFQTVVMMSKDQEIPAFLTNFAEKVVVGRDSRPQKGPLQGIVDALPLLPPESEFIYLVACDLPYLNAEWLGSMQQKMSSEVDVVHAVDEGITNPLLALYRKEVLENASYVLHSGHPRPLNLWEGKRLTGITAPSHQHLVCKDANTPEDFAEALSYYKHQNQSHDSLQEDK